MSDFEEIFVSEPAGAGYKIRLSSKKGGKSFVLMALTPTGSGTGVRITREDAKKLADKIYEVLK